MCIRDRKVVTRTDNVQCAATVLRHSTYVLRETVAGDQLTELNSLWIRRPIKLDVDVAGDNRSSMSASSVKNSEVTAHEPRRYTTTTTYLTSDDQPHTDTSSSDDGDTAVVDSELRLGST